MLAKRHEVTFGVRDPEHARHLELRDVVGEGIAIDSVHSAAGRGEIVILATPWPATEAAIQAAGNLSGKLLVDCTNPLEPDLSGLTVGHTWSGGEQVAEWASGASVFKAFNTTGSSNMESPVVDDRQTVMFFCGDDDNYRDTVAALIHDVGFEAVDAGPLQAARWLEPWAMVWISLSFLRRFGTDFAFALVRR